MNGTGIFLRAASLTLALLLALPGAAGGLGEEPPAEELPLAGTAPEEGADAGQAATRVAGVGTEANPIRIASGEDLAAFARRYNSGGFATAQFPPKLYVTLDADITVDGGMARIGSGERPFTGVFSGGGHVVSGLASAAGGGLFGVVDGGEISDVSLAGVALGPGGSGPKGALADSLLGEAVVRRVYVAGRVAGGGPVGGIVGEAAGSARIEDVRADAELSAEGPAGGIVGNLNENASLRRALATGTVRGGFAGGAVGQMAQAASATDLAALTATVYGGEARRVAGGGGSLTTAHAWDGMRVNGGPLPGAGNAGGADGAALSAEAALSTAFWAEALPLGAAWETAEGKLPVLAGLAGQSAAPPLYFDPLGGYIFDTVTIGTAAEFLAFAAAVNGGDSYRGKRVLLTADITLPGANPAGLPVGQGDNLFEGEFDGGGHALRGLTLTGHSGAAGLFSRLENAAVKNLTVTVGSISGGSDVGALAGEVAEGGRVRIENCHARYEDESNPSPAPLQGTQNVGGLLGDAGSAVLSGCGVDLNLRRSGAGGIGGIAGAAGALARFTGCMFAGRIEADGTGALAGGIVGNLAGGTVESSFVQGSASGDGSIQTAGADGSAGGIVGMLDGGLVLNCYNNQMTVSGGDAAGGIAGAVSGGALRQCYAAAGVSGARGGGIAGVVRGKNDVPGSVESCVALSTSAGLLQARVVCELEPGGHLTQNNCAWAEMPAVQSGDSAENGVGVALAALLDGRHFSSMPGFDDESLWLVSGYRLPILAGLAHTQRGEIPEYFDEYLDDKYLDGKYPYDSLQGGGTAEDPYRLYTPANLFAMADGVNSGRVGYYNGHFKLMNDIDLSGARWTPIGTNIPEASKPFGGVMIGGGHTIQNFVVPAGATLPTGHAIEQNAGGLFGYVNGAAISGLTVAGSVHQNGLMPAALAGSAASSSFTDCLALHPVLENPSLNQGMGAGLLVASATNSSFTHCTAEGDFAAGAVGVGGIVGVASGGEITGCRYSGSLSGISRVGGIAGSAKGLSLAGCSVNANIRAENFATETTNPYYAGGLVGYAETVAISAGRAAGSVWAARYAGGIAGQLLRGEAAASASAASVSGERYMGGIAGAVSGAAVKNCYTTGLVLAEAGYAGGIAGIVQSGSPSGKKYGGSVTNCYSLAGVEGRGGYAGGIAGQLASTASGSSGKNTVKASVALNVAVRDGQNTKNVGRVAGAQGSGVTLSGCYATAAMDSPIAEKSGGVHGATAALSALARPAFWQGAGFAEAAGWRCAQGALPLLAGAADPAGWDGSLPFHLAGFARRFALALWVDGLPLPEASGEARVDMGIAEREVVLVMSGEAGQDWTHYETGWKATALPEADSITKPEALSFGAPYAQGESVAAALSIPAHFKGTVSVEATDLNSGETAQFTFRVVERAAAVELAPLEDYPLGGLALDKGQSAQILATVLPEGAADKSIAKWATSNKKIAEVTGNADGTATVTATGYGSANITATSADGGHTGIIAVRVAPALTENNFSLNKKSHRLNAGKTVTLSPKYADSKVAVHSLAWRVVPLEESQNGEYGEEALAAAEAIATVDAKGKVSALAPGAVRVELYAVPVVGQPQRAYCELSVLRPAAKVGIVEAQKFIEHDTPYDKDTLLTGKTVRMVPESCLGEGDRFGSRFGEGNPANAGDEDPRHNREVLILTAVKTAPDSTDALSWQSSDKKGQYIRTEELGDGRLRVTALAPGKVSITAKLGGKSAKVNLQIVVPVAALSIQNPLGGAHLSTGATAGFKVTVADNPLAQAAPSNRKVTWESDNPAVASVGASNGKVKGLAPGSAVITATSADDPGVSHSVEIWVVARATSAKMRQGAFQMRSGAPYEDATQTDLHRGLSLMLNGGGPLTETDPQSGGAYIRYEWSIPEGSPLVFAGGEGYTSAAASPSLRVSTSPEAPLAKNVKVTVTAKVTSTGGKTLKATVAVTVLSAAGSANYKELLGFTLKPHKSGPDEARPLPVGTTRAPTLSFNPASPGNRNVEWTAELFGAGWPEGAKWQDYILLNTSTGAVKGLAPTGGRLIKITAASCDNPALSQSYSFAVAQPAASVKISAPDGRKSIGVEPAAWGGGRDVPADYTLVLTAAVAPDTVSNPEVTWSSAQDGKVIRLVDNGDGSATITGLKAGSATVKATAADGSRKSASFKLTVVQQVDDFILTAPKANQAEGGGAKVDRGKSFTLGAAFNAGAKGFAPKNKNLSWESSDPAVASVSSKGVVKGLADGVCTITATSADGGIARSLEVTVCAKATKVTMQQKKFNLYIGRQVTLSAAATPGLEELSAEWDSLSWTIANREVLGFVGGGVEAETGSKVSTTTDAGVGAVTVEAAAALPAGKTSVTVRLTASAPGGKSANLDIVVTNVRKNAARVHSLRLDKNSLWLQNGKSATLKATLIGETLPGTAKAATPGNKNLVWSVTAPDGGPTAIATVDANGKVTAKGNGTVRVTVRAVDAANGMGWPNKASCLVYCVAKG